MSNNYDYEKHEKEMRDYIKERLTHYTIGYNRDFMSFCRDNYRYMDDKEIARYRKAIDKSYCEKNKKWFSHINEIKKMNKNTYCAWFYNFLFGDRGAPNCTKLKDVDFELGMIKKNIWIGQGRGGEVVLKINNKFYNMDDIQALKDKYDK